MNLALIDRFLSLIHADYTTEYSNHRTSNPTKMFQMCFQWCIDQHGDTCENNCKNNKGCMKTEWKLKDDRIRLDHIGPIDQWQSYVYNHCREHHPQSRGTQRGRDMHHAHRTLCKLIQRVERANPVQQKWAHFKVFWSTQWRTCQAERKYCYNMCILKLVAALAAETKLGVLFLNTEEARIIRLILHKLGYP